MRPGHVWSENILWLEFQASHTNTSVTSGFELWNSGLDSRSPKNRGNLTDRGRVKHLYSDLFSDINFKRVWIRNQDDSDLLTRSRYAAVWANAYVMKILDVTKEHWNEYYTGKAYLIDMFLGSIMENDLDNVNLLSVSLSMICLRSSGSGGSLDIG